MDSFSSSRASAVVGDAPRHSIKCDANEVSQAADEQWGQKAGLYLSQTSRSNAREDHYPFDSRDTGSVNKLSKSKQDVAATLLKMDHFADRLASIRSGIAARNESDHILQLQHVRLPQTLAKSAPAPVKALSRAEDSFENLKLPLLQLVAANNERAAPPSNSYLSIEAIRHRSDLQVQFKTDAERLAEVEQAAAAALQNADRLSEESRIAIVMYSQNERSWSFDERATRYQKVMEAKLQAENARVEAEEQKKVVQRLRSELVNPYGALLSSRSPRPRVKRSTHLSSRTVTPEPALDMPSEDYVRVWILAASSTNLGFTPRATSSATILGAEKELSTHVVYYAAASMANEDKHSPQLSDDDRAKLLADDCPPQSGWISCFNFGVALVPQVTSTRSSIETWVVSGAGIGHLNGKYILNGIHDNVRKFKSSAGIELFRKRVPVSSSLAQGLHDAPSNKSRRREISSPDTSESVRPEDDDESEAHSVASSTPLPSALKAIENDETNFSSMSKIGSWLGANEVREKYRRRREAQGREREADGAGMMVQDTKGREDTNSDIQISRSEASAELCREWVLFLSCSRRQEKPKDGTSVPPKQKIGLGCLKRHYYISVEEKEAMTIWAQDVEAALEKNVLQSIIRREAALYRVHHLCNKCVSKFQQNLSRDAEKITRKILVELNTVRFLSVRVLEAIDKWRAHARKLGFARVDVRNGSGDVATKSKQDSKAGGSQGMNSSSTEAPLLGWSASITISTGRQLYKRSNAFASKIKRFCRAEDAIGKKEQHIVYLGYFATKMEAERAYEEFATAEARRLNTTVAHLPRHRNVFRSCGKHFAVESECFGPSVCIECKVKQLATLSSGAGADEWAPPFFYLPGENYILKMANDLDFLDKVPPLKSLLNDGHGSDEPVFPILGNVFLLPKTPIQDPSLAVFTTCGLAQAPRLGVALATEKDNHEINDETLDRNRILAVQTIFLQELQMYLPHLFPEGTSIQSRVRKDLRTGCSASKKQDDEDEIDSAAQEYRIVEALYWDRCAALRIQQQRMPLPFRQPNVWCRPDAGEWSSLLVRGKNQLHFLFEMKLALAGKETQEKRRQILKALRKLQKTPLYWIPSREHFTTLIADGYGIKGDVVLLEVKNVAKYLEKYDIWCCKTLAIQRWYRGVNGRRKAKARKKALVLACSLRKRFTEQVVQTANAFYMNHVVPLAVRRAIKKISKPEFTTALKLSDEFVVVSFHSLKFYQPATIQSSKAVSRRLERSVCCTSCARRFHVRAEFWSLSGRFEVSSGVCCCSLNGGDEWGTQSTMSECWLVRAYNPASNVVYRMRMENSLIQQLLSSLHSLKFGNSAPSAAADCTTTARNPELCPKNPVAEKWQMHGSAAVASIQANFYRVRGEKAYQELLNWRLLSSEATQKRKIATIARDRTLDVLNELKKSYLVSVEKAKRALDFTSRQFHEAQAWDPLENANDWKLLVQKRQLQKDIELKERELDKCRMELFQAAYNEQFLRARAGQVQEQYEHGLLPLIQYENQKMEEASVLENTTKTIVERSMRQICDHFLTLRDGYFVPTRRQLVLQSKTWKTRSNVRVAVPGLQRLRNVLRRRVLMLRNFGKTQQRQERMIIEISVSRSPFVEGCNDVWVSAYNPKTSFVQEVFLEWELVELLVELKSKKSVLSSQTGHKRSSLCAIADQLLGMAMLDRFTGEFTLRKLQFYHHMRLLQSQFLSSKWFLDVKKGRKCGDGDEILRQAACVDGRLVVAVVYENWGDLTFAIYHSASGKTYRLTVLLREIFDLLSSKPLTLRLWVCSVKSNNYTPSLLMYLLKHVRFRLASSDFTSQQETIIFESTLPSKSRAKRFQKAMQIDRRKVLLSMKEDAAGDLAVDVFDWQQSHTYKLLLEREHIRRILRHAGATTSSSSRTHLLLQKNRQELYEWISRRLTFQNLLDHPQLLAAAHSPLVVGAHIRQSFRIFNQWIASSVRNPLQSVQTDEMNRWVADVDAAAFAQLQFDQLALVTEQMVPFDYDKESIGTLDWFVSSLRERRSQVGESPYMKMDVFLRNHDLCVRVRKEIHAETETRLERSAREAMQTEEKLSLRAEIQSALDSTASLFASWQMRMKQAKEVIDERYIQWRYIHQEMATRVTSTDSSQTTANDARNESVSDYRTFHAGNFSDLLSNVGIGEMDFVIKAIELNSGALNAASRFLSKCDEYVELELRPALPRLDASISSAAQGACSVKTLSTMWREALDFQRSSTIKDFNFTGIQDVAKATEGESVGWTLTPNAREIQPHAANIDSDTYDDVQGCLDTGMLIPSASDAPIQEIFLGGFVSKPRLAEFLDSVVIELKSLVLPDSLRRRISSKDVNLVVKQVHHGILVYQTAANCRFDCEIREQLGWNARASALAMESGIFGPALYYPLQQGQSFVSRLVHASDVYHELAVASDPNQSSNNDHVQRRKQLGNRVKQQLPWKVFASERLQAARLLRRMRATDRFSLAKCDATMETVSVATRLVTFRQLELLYGDCRLDSLRARLADDLSVLLAVEKRDCSTTNATTQSAWSLRMNKPLVMRNVLVLADSEGKPISISASKGKGGLRLEHLQVEVDNLEQPRRLIFSCQELQSQQKYFVDCSYYQLQKMMRSIDASCSPTACTSSQPLSIADWRACAQKAATFLVLWKKNGTTCLDFTVHRESVENFDEAHAEQTRLAKASNTDDAASIQCDGSSHHHEAETMATAILSSIQQRFCKHQQAIRLATCRGLLSKQRVSNTSRQLGTEWMRMMQEDFASQECRGLLVLDTEMLKKLKTAYTTATKCTKKKKFQSSNASETTTDSSLSLLRAQLLEIAKEMGLPHNIQGENGTPNEIESAILAIRESVRRRQRSRRSLSLVTPLADFREVAEWWRIHKLHVDQEHSASNRKL